MELKMSSDFESLDINSIKEEINKLKDERIKKLISGFENQLNIKIHSRFDNEKIEELKNLLEKYDRKDEIEDMVKFGTWKQIDKLKALLRKYECQKEDEEIEELKNLLEKYDCADELEEIEELDLERWEQIEQLKDLLEECVIIKNMDKKTKKLKPLITEYKHQRSLPTLPKKPHGSLFGIGFIYDEDIDKRILVAIELLKDNKKIVAVYEHKGIITIYSKDPCETKKIEVCNDIWPVYNYVPENGKCVEVKRNYNFS
jgi:hypothetical protein